jgi:hypothetical protein
MKPDKVLTNEDRATISKLLLQLEKTRDLQFDGTLKPLQSN